MKIAIASYGQETSSFSPVATTLETFELYGLFAGAEMLPHFGNHFDRLHGVATLPPAVV